MPKHETMHDLFVSLGVSNTPLMHWLDSTGWILAKHMYGQVQSATMKAIHFA
jgi:hypothetical protein